MPPLTAVIKNGAVLTALFFVDFLCDIKYNFLYIEFLRRFANGKNEKPIG